MNIFFGLYLFITLVALSWTDLRTYRLPDVLTFPLMIIGILFSYLTDNLLSGSIGLVVGYVVFVALETAFLRLRGKPGLGRGDAKLLAAGGAWCGWMGLPFIVLIASGSGLLALIFPSFRKSADRGRVPFGPFLAYAIFVVWLAYQFVV